MMGRAVYIGVGSNMGDRMENLRRGLGAMNEMGEILAVSSVYETEPWGQEHQPNFLNAVALLDTPLEPRPLLRGLKDIEAEFRRSPERWGPRELDLDILLYEGVCMSEPDLAIPHPRLSERDFVLVPLWELFDAGWPRLGFKVPRPPGKKSVAFFAPQEEIA